MIDNFGAMSKDRYKQIHNIGPHALDEKGFVKGDKCPKCGGNLIDFYSEDIEGSSCSSSCCDFDDRNNIRGFIYGQDGQPVPLSVKDTKENRQFMDWLRIHDRSK